MHETLYETIIFGKPLVITPWKLIGFLGVFLFAGRWFVQLIASKRSGRPTLPRLFWYMSITGSLLLLSYFIFGRTDAVGVLSNAFPLTVSSYNLYLDFKSRAREKAEAGDDS